MSEVLAAFASAGLVAALSLGASPYATVEDLSRAVIASHAEDEGRSFASDAGTIRPERRVPPPCLGDVCQPRVSVPGYEPRYLRPSRTEFTALALERAHLEPFATIGWVLVETGIRLDYTPVVFDGPNSGGHGWGAALLRLRLRLDAHNRLVFARRPR